MAFRDEAIIKHAHELVSILTRNLGADTVVQDYTGTLADRERGVDYCLDTKHGEITVGVRVRANKWEHCQEFTIRAVARNKGRTEIDKMREGDAADYYLYAYETEGGDALSSWVLVDVARLVTTLLPPPGEPHGMNVVVNGDGRTGFVKLPFAALEAAGCVVARNQARPQRSMFGEA